MNDMFNQEYSRFTREKLRPAVASIAARKRSSLVYGIAAGVVCFAVGAAVVYTLLAPYRELMKSDSLSFWPLMLLAPAALAILAFSIIFVLGLRKTVVEFQKALTAGVAEFIDPGLVHEGGNPLSSEKIAASRLFPGNPKINVGRDRFRGRSGNAAVELADIRLGGRFVRQGGRNVREGDGRKGLFLAARYEKAFPYPFFVFPASEEVSRSDLERALADDGFALPGGLVRVDRSVGQVLLPSGREGGASSAVPMELLPDWDEIHAANAGSLRLAVLGGDMYLAVLSPGSGKDEGIFEGFDFDGCREFCRDGKFAMAMARIYGERLERDGV